MASVLLARIGRRVHCEEFSSFITSRGYVEPLILMNWWQYERIRQKNYLLLQLNYCSMYLIDSFICKSENQQLWMGVSRR